jgi:Ca-activated chloride channel homolog
MNKALLTLALLLISTSSVVAQTKREASSLTYGLVIDCSGSVRQNLNYIVASASSIVNSNSASDETFIIKFISADKITTAQELTSDKTKLINSIGDLYVEGGNTAIVDGVYLAAQYLNDHPSNGRRALVLISDGEDLQSYYTLDFLLKYLQEKRIPVYILTFGHQTRRSLAFINKLAQDSGGKLVFAETGKDLPAKAADLIRVLREGNVNPTVQPNKSLDASGGSVFLNLLGTAKGALIRAAASTQTLDCC